MVRVHIDSRYVVLYFDALSVEGAVKLAEFVNVCELNDNFACPRPVVGRYRFPSVDI